MNRRNWRQGYQREVVVFAEDPIKFKWKTFSTSTNNGSPTGSSGNWIEHGQYRWEVDARPGVFGSFHVRVYRFISGAFGHYHEMVDNHWSSDHDRALAWCEEQARNIEEA